MKLKIVLACLSLAATAATAAEPSPFVGIWDPERVAGVAGVPRLTFTPDGRLLSGYGRVLGTDPSELLGSYQVEGRRVSARSAFGETYSFELIADGRLCVFPGPGLMPLAGDRDAQLAAGQCFRKSTQST
jgi:hypothetical protein